MIATALIILAICWAQSRGFVLFDLKFIFEVTYNYKIVFNNITFYFPNIWSEDENHNTSPSPIASSKTLIPLQTNIHIS